jgi:hypothetical protein
MYKPNRHNFERAAVFKPNRHQRALIEAALETHRHAQELGRYAPERLVEKWSSEVGIAAHRGRTLSPKRRIVVTSKLTRGQTTVPACARKALNAGRSARLVWYLESDGTVIVRAKKPHRAR